MNERGAVGAAGEAAVARYFERLGYAVEARNWRCRAGELDLVVARGDLLVFVEVRTVRTDYLATPVLTVGRAKQRRVARAADAYLRRRREAPSRVRFDVVGVRRGRGRAAIHHVEDAFVPDWAF